MTTTSLLKALSGIYLDFLRVKTYDLMVRRRRCFCIVSFLEASFLENLFVVQVWPLVVVVPVATMISSAGFLFFYFLLAVCILGVFLDTMLLQRLDVIDIYFVLIYFLYQKKA